MILIIGAGPAGLSVSYHLEADSLILEPEAEPGGLCRSFELAGAVFDFGGHAFFTRHEYVRDLVTRFCSVGLYTQPRRAWVYHSGIFVPYPIQSHLYGLPDFMVQECLAGLKHVIETRDDAKPANFQEWIDCSFGPGLSKHFLSPYNRKLCAMPLSEIMPLWSADRIVQPDFDAILRGASNRVEFKDFPNAVVSYPASGGFFGLYQGLADVVRHRLRRGRVERVDLDRRCITTAEGDFFEYDHLISTMPLDQLITAVERAPRSCIEAVACLRYSSLHLVNLVYDRPPHPTEMQRVYTADPDVPFHKLVINSNSSRELRARNRWGFQGEVSWSSRHPVDRSGLEERVHRSLLDMGVIQPASRIIGSSVVTLKHAYPLHTERTGSARTFLLRWLRERNVYCAGRFGEWLYINSDDAVMRGKVRAEELNAWHANERTTR